MKLGCMLVSWAGAEETMETEEIGVMSAKWQRYWVRLSTYNHWSPGGGDLVPVLIERTLEHTVSIYYDCDYCEV